MELKKKSLTKNTFIYAIGSFGSKILSFLLVPLYSYYLNKDEFGYFDLVTTAISLIVPFATLQISDSAFRWLLTSNDRDDIIKKTITNSFFLIALNILLIVIFSFILYFIHPLNGHFIITIICVNSMIYPFFQQIARGLNRSRLFAFNGLLYTFIYLIGNMLFLLVLKLSIEALFYSTFFAFFICSVFLFFQLKLFKYIKISSIDIKYLKELIAYSIPLIPNTISWWLINSVNKYLILLVLGISANGIFAMSNRFPAILVLINQVFTLAWQESAIVNSNSEGKKEYYSGILDKLMKIQFALVVLLTLLSRFIVEFLINSEFHEAWLFMPVLYLSVAFLSFSGFYGAIYLGVMKTKAIFTTTIFGSLTNIILGYFLVKYFGLMGISIATCSGYFVLFSMRVFSTKKIIDLNFPIKTFVKYLLAVISSFFIVYKYSTTVSLLFVIFFLIFFLIDNNKELIGFYKKLLSKIK